MRDTTRVLTFGLTALLLALPAAAQAPVERAGIGSFLSAGDILATIVYGLLGILLALAGYFLYDLITPFSLTKELVEDQNLAMGIVVGAMFIGVAMIVAAAIGG